MMSWDQTGNLQEKRNMAEFQKVADSMDLPPGTSMCIELSGEKVALFNVGGAVYAIADACTHVGGSLSEGEVDGTVVTCPLHGATFELTTGDVTGPPAASAVTRYEVRVEGDAIQVAPQ